MKRWLGRFVFDAVVKYINYLEDPYYDKLMSRVFRPAWTRKVPLPEPSGKTRELYS